MLLSRLPSCHAPPSTIASRKLPWLNPMPIDLCDYEKRVPEAVRLHWLARHDAANKIGKKLDQGTRGQVTGGRHLGPLARFFVDVILANGVRSPDIHVNGRLLTLPGFFRPTKNWDLVVMNGDQLMAAIEFKSQVGSIGNNANNRAEEVVGLGVDLWKAHREGAFGKGAPMPFVGYFFVLEDSPKVWKASSEPKLHFPVLDQFKGGVSYAKRYEILCDMLVQEKIFTSASVILSTANAGIDGSYKELSDSTSVKRFVATLAGHVATAVAG